MSEWKLFHRSTPSIVAGVITPEQMIEVSVLQVRLIMAFQADHDDDQAFASQDDLELAVQQYFVAKFPNERRVLPK
jgi:hypothetical protein